MTIKDLLLYLDQSPESRARLEAAIELADQLDAHLTALCLIAEPYLRGGSAHHMPEAILREHLAHAQAEANTAIAAARELADGRGVELAVHCETGSLDRLPAILAHHARHVDLTIVGQPNPESSGVDEALLAETAFMDSGHPALVIPYAGTPTLPPQRVLIAWDGSREAARATTDALPLLGLAEDVDLLVVDERDVSSHVGARPGTEVATHLARHGVTAKLHEVKSAGRGVAETILAEAAASGADLIVMGGYGHSRLRERVLGGPTRHMLEHMTIPVLFSH